MKIVHILIAVTVAMGAATVSHAGKASQRAKDAKARSKSKHAKDEAIQKAKGRAKDEIKTKALDEPDEATNETHVEEAVEEKIKTGAPIMEESNAPFWKGVSGYEVDGFEVLDISIPKKWAAIKLVSHYSDPAGEEYGSIDCKYGGMAAMPLSGAVIAVWDLASQKVGSEHVVYGLAMKPDQCFPAATSAKNLADAKAAAKTKGLDLSKKPAPFLPKNGVFSLMVGGRSVTVTTSTACHRPGRVSGCNGVLDSNTQVTGWSNGTEIDESEESDDMMRTVTMTIRADDKPVYRGAGQFTIAGVGSASASVVQAFVEGDEAVFVIAFRSGNMEGGSTDYVLTTPVNLGAERSVD